MYAVLVQQVGRAGLALLWLADGQNAVANRNT